jgi:hypothetical protein
MISGRRRKSFFGYRVGSNNNEVGLLNQSTANDLEVKAFEYRTFDLLYTEFKKLYITPLLEHNYNLLALNYQRKVSSEYSKTVNVNKYIKKLTPAERSQINTDQTLFEYYVSEVSRYVNLYGNDNLRYSILADSLNMSQKGYLLFSDFNSTTQFVDRLKQQIETILNDYNDDNKLDNVKTYQAALSSTTTIKAGISEEYIIYTQKYGFPIAGIFDVQKLSEIQLELANGYIQTEEDKNYINYVLETTEETEETKDTEEK